MGKTIGREAAPIGWVIRQSSSVLQDLMRTLVDIRALDRQWKSIAGELGEHCAVGAFKEGVLTLVTRESHWMTPVRYQSPALIEKLKTLEGFASITKIRCRMVLEGPTALRSS